MWRTLPDPFSQPDLCRSPSSFGCRTSVLEEACVSFDVYHGALFRRVVAMHSTGQLSLSSSLKVKSSASAAHAHSRPSAVVLAHACRHAHRRTTRTSVAESPAGCCGGILESVQRAPAKASSGIPTTPPQLHLFYRNTMLFDKLLP